MLRSRRVSSGAFAVALACAGACSSTPASSGSNEAGGDPNSAGDSAIAGAEAGSGGASAGAHAVEANAGAHAGGASSGGAHGGGASSGGAASSGAGSGNSPASAGASGSTSSSSGVRRIFYLDVQGRVLTFDEDKPTPRTLVSSAGQGPDGIAVDVAGGHLFWTTMGVPADNDGSLRRSDLDGSKVTTVVPTGGSFTPKQLKLDLAGERLYWSDREGMRIQRAAMDGSRLETLVTVATGDSARKDAGNWCVGLALDLVHGFIYWTQKGPDDDERRQRSRRSREPRRQRRA